MGLAEELYKDMPNAEGFGAGKYFDDGRYDLRVKSIKCITSRNASNGNAGKHFFTVEFEVLSSSNPGVEVGESRSWQVKIEGNTYAFSDIKNFIFALCLDTDPKDAPPPKKNPELHAMATNIAMALSDEEFAAKADDVTQAFVADVVGMPVKLEAFKKATLAKPGKPAGVFTLHQWSPATAAPAAA